MERLLRVTAKHFVAGAVLEKRGGKWCCTEAAPIIKYMVGMESAKIKAYIEKKRWGFEPCRVGNVFLLPTFHGYRGQTIKPSAHPTGLAPPARAAERGR